MNAKRQAWLIACLIFFSFFALYLKTFCSSLYPDDSGETATLAWTLSIGHPPGYPLHTLLGRVATLLPLGDAALRMNLLASFLGALCAPLAWLLARQFCPKAIALLSPLMLCLGPVYWHNAEVAKGSVYMLNNLLTLGMLAALTLRRGGASEALFFMLLGLGSAHHYMSQLVMLPCYALLLRGRPLRRLAAQSLWLLPGLSLYAYLFIRAAQDPPINWGEIRSFADFLFFFSRAQYAAGELSRTAATSLHEFTYAVRLIAAEGRWIGLLALMAWAGQADTRARRLALFAGAAAPVAAVTLYLNLQGERLSIMEPYLFPSYLCAALLAPAGLQRLRDALKPALRTASAWAAALALLLPAALGYASADKSAYFYAIDNARNVLGALPRNAALFSSGDAIIFPIWYLQQVKHERSDVALVGTPVLPMDWVRDALHTRYPALRQPRIEHPVGAESIDRIVEFMLAANQGGLPLYFSYNQMNEGIHGWKLIPEGGVYLAAPLSAPDPLGLSFSAEARLSSFVTRGFDNRNLDSRTMTLIVHDHAIHHNSLGTWLEDHGDFASALQQYLKAAAINAKAEEFPFNAGNALHQMGRKEEAIGYYRRSLSLNPRYESAWFNLAATEFMLGRNAEGCEALTKTLEINPHNQAALAQKGRCQNLQ